MPVPCPYCETTLEGGHVDVTAWGQTFGVKLRWKRDGAGLFEYRKILGWFDRRPAGLCPSCGAVVIAPLRGDRRGRRSRPGGVIGRGR